MRKRCGFSSTEYQRLVCKFYKSCIGLHRILGFYSLIASLKPERVNLSDHYQKWKLSINTENAKQKSEKKVSFSFRGTDILKLITVIQFF